MDIIAGIIACYFTTKIIKMKYYFFRDLNHEDNLSDGKTYNAAGIVDKVFNTKETLSGKDLSVTYLNPFTCEVISTWRTYSEAEVFEVSKWEWENADKYYRTLNGL